MAQTDNTLEQAHELALLWIRGQDVSGKTPEDFVTMFFDARTRIKAKLAGASSGTGEMWFGLKGRRAEQ